MPIDRVFDTLFQRIRHLRPKQRITQVKIFVWLVVWIYESREVGCS